MNFSDESIEEFRAIYRKEFQEDISKDDAVGMARRLVNLYRIFLRPLPPEVRKAFHLDEPDGGHGDVGTLEEKL